ncbi:MAG: molybdopterin cofactor-binding domain-containing protein [Myxococcota bacterium]
MTTRRSFLKGTAGASAALYVGFQLPGCSSDSAKASRRFQPNAFLEATVHGSIIFTLARVEMGQGTLTSETMMVAEELGMDPEAIEIRFAPADPAFRNPMFGVQGTGGSTSTASSFEILRKAGAVMREAFIGAAASAFGVDRAQVRFQDGQLVDTASQRALHFKELVDQAHVHLDEDAEPKPRSEWRILGRSRPRLDNRSKTTGTAVFGADAGPSDAEVAVVLRGPYGSHLLGFEAQDAEAVDGVLAIFEISNGVAVVATGYPEAMKGAKKVKTEWSKSEFSTESMWTEYAEILNQGSASDIRSEGSALSSEDGALEAEYRLPFLAHAPMEPPVATAWVRELGADIWLPTQGPGGVAVAVAKLTGLGMDSVRVHSTLLGGAFGRKSYVDYASEAVEVAMRRDKPVRLQWSREDDIRFGYFRQASLHRLRGALSEGRASHWEHRIVAETAMYDVIPDMLSEIMPRFVTKAAVWSMKTFSDDPSIVEGAKDLPYAIPNLRVGYATAEGPVKCAFWRAVGHSHNGFVVESFVDELAHAAGQDPVDFRRGLLEAHPRHLGVLELAVQEAGWGQAVPEGHALGVAVHHSFGSYVAEVAEVSMEEGRPRVHKVTAAVDCGTVMNPDGVKAQIEGGIIFGLSAAMTQEAISFEGGAVQQSNFHDFQVLRMNECPDIEVHIVESDAPPTGVGEPGLPPIAAAVGNAIFALTGRRLRSLPFELV